MEIAKLHVTLAADTAAAQAGIMAFEASAKAAMEGIGASTAPASAGLSGVGTAATTAATGLTGLATHAAEASAGMSGLGASSAAASSGIQTAGGHMGGLGSAAEGASTRVSMLGVAFGAMVGALAVSGILAAAHALGEVGKSSLQMAGEMDSSRASFTVLLHSAKEADVMLRGLVSFAATTPFELRGLQDSAKRLLAFGFDARDTIPILNSVGNAASMAGTGAKAALDGIVLALGQMNAKGKVSAEEMNQMADRGINGWKMLAEHIGKSIPEAMKMAEKGTIDSSTAIEGILAGLNKEFKGHMAAQSKLFLGAMSNMHDGADQAMTAIGEKILTTFDLADAAATAGLAFQRLAFDITNNLGAALDQAKASMYATFTDPAILAAIVGIGSAVVLGIGGPIAVTMAEATIAVGTAVAAMVAATWPFMLAGAAIAALAYPVIQNWDMIKGGFADIFGKVSSMASTFGGWIAKVATTIYDDFKWAADGIAATFAPLFNSIGAAARAVFNALPETAQAGLSKFGAMMSDVSIHAGSALGAVPSAMLGAMAPTFVMGQNMALALKAQMVDTGADITAAMGGAGATMSGLWQRYTKDASTAAFDMADNMQLHLGKANKALEGHGAAHKAAATEAQKAAKAIEKAYEAVPLKMAALDAVARDAADGGFKVLTEQAKILENAIKSMTENSVKAADPRLRALSAMLKDVRGHIDALSEGFKAQADFGAHLTAMMKPFKDLNVAIGEVNIKSDVMGVTFNRSKALLAEVDKALEKSSHMWNANSSAVQGLKARHEALTNNSAVEQFYIDQTYAADKLANSLHTTADMTAYSTALNSAAVKGLEALAAAHITTGAAVDELKSALAFTGAEGEVAMAKLKTSMTDVQTAVQAFAQGMGTIGEVLGIQLNDPVTKAISNSVQLGLALMQVGTAIQTLTPAFAAMGASAMPALKGLAEGAVNLASDIGTMSTEFLAATGPAGILAMSIGAVAVAGAALVAAAPAMSAWANNSADIFASLARGWHNATELAHGYLAAITGGTYDMQMWSDAQAEAAAATYVVNQNLNKTDAAIQAVTMRLNENGEAWAKVANAMRTGLDGSYSSAIKGFLDGTKDLTEGLRSGVRDAITTGIVEAIAQKEIIKRELGTLPDMLATALQGGDMAGASGIIASIGAKIPAITSQMEGLLAPLKGALSNAFAPIGDAITGIKAGADKSLSQQDFNASMPGAHLGDEADLGARVKIAQKAMEDLHAAGADGSAAFDSYRASMVAWMGQIDALKAAAKGGVSSTVAAAGVGSAVSSRVGDDAAVKALQSDVARALDAYGSGSQEAMAALDALHARQTLPAPAPSVAAASAYRVEASPSVAITLNYTGSGRREDADDMMDLITKRLAQAGIRVA